MAITPENLNIKIMIYTNLDKLIDRVFNDSNMLNSTISKSPIFDSSEFRTYFFSDGSTTKYVFNENGLKIALPGFSKEELNIEAEANTLHISAKVENEDAFKKSFSMKFRIPAEIDTESITASMQNGVLEINFGKKVENKKIKIS